MKKLFLLCIVAAVFVLWCESLWAQQTQGIPKPVADFIAKPQPDILKEKLSQANEQMLEEADRPIDDLNKATDSKLKNEADEFTNPFIPQIPQAVKPKPFVAPKASAEPPPANIETTPIPQFIVAGIVWNSKKPQAIINEEVTAIGDQVSNWTVSEITEEGVRMTFGEQNLWVKPVINPEGQTQTQSPNFYQR